MIVILTANWYTFIIDWISGHKDTLFLKRLDRANFLKSEVSAMAYEL